MSMLNKLFSFVASAMRLATAPAIAAQIDPFKWLKEQITGPTLDVPVQHPPELQIHIDGVAIAPPDGPRCAQPLSTRLEQAFLQAGITVVDRQRLDKVLNEYKLQASGAVDEKTAAKIGQILGAQALIFTHVAQCDTTRDLQESFRDEKTGKVYYNYTTQASITGTVRVVALTTGRVMAAQPFEAQIQHSNSEGYPDAHVALSEAEKAASESVKKTLLPWTEMVSMPFNNDKQCELSVAHGLVKAREFNRALEQSRTNATSCAASNAKPVVKAKAHHNLGVLQMYFGDYDAALASFTEASRIHSSKATQKALADCKQAHQHSQALAAYNSAAPSRATVTAGSTPPSPTRAKAGSPPIATFQPQTLDRKAESGPSIKERLVELNDLCKSQLLTPDECTQRRKEILKKLDER
jgi:curli biogenesis system outer membrane secretion channel CsgG